MLEQTCVEAEGEAGKCGGWREGDAVRADELSPAEQ